jgi:hypothetical protein
VNHLASTDPEVRRSEPLGIAIQGKKAELSKRQSIRNAEEVVRVAEANVVAESDLPLE